MEYGTETLQWRGLSLEVRYCPDWSQTYREVYGYGLAHLQVKCHRQIPISKTGYVSRFDRTDNVEAEGGPAAYVLKWLDHAAPAPAADEPQLSLFQPKQWGGKTPPIVWAEISVSINP